MTDRSELALTVEDHDKAFTEVCFLLEVLVDALGELVGRSTPTLGVTAGRQMGKKLPIHLTEPDMRAVLAALSERLASGWAMEIRADATGADVEFGKCAIRDVCKNRDLELGGELCQMFHYYLSGMAAELCGKPVRASIRSAGETCQTRMDS